jgi:hypothetical protein
MTSTLNVELQTGTLGETIVVSGESPTVDVQNARQSQVVENTVVTDMRVFRSNPGSQISANYVVSSAVVAQTLGRPLAGGTANVTINVLEPGQMYRDRINLLDLRVAKLVDLGRRRLNFGLDVFNAFNSDVVLNSINTYGASWLTPTQVQTARQLQGSERLDF